MDALLMTNSSGDSGDFNLDAVIQENGALPYDLAFLLPPSGSLVMAIRTMTNGIIPLLGIFSNVLSIAMVIRGKLHKQFTYAMVLNLSVTDLTLCINYITMFLPGVVLERFPFWIGICNFRQMMIFTPMFVSVLSFFLTALHRYLTIVHNIGHLRLFSIKWLPLVLGVQWLVSLLLSFVLSYKGEAFALLWRDNLVVTSDAIWMRMEVMNSLMVMAPLLIVLVFYIHIYIVVRRASSKVQARSSRHQSRMARVLFILYLSAAVVYIPYVTFFFTFNLMTPNQMRIYYLLAYLFMVLISAANPFLYMVLFTPIRKQYQRMCGCKDSRVTEVTVLSGTVLSATN